MTNVLFGGKVFLLRYYMLTYYMTNVLFGAKVFLLILDSQLLDSLRI